jgi:hypothetical protein
MLKKVAQVKEVLFFKLCSLSLIMSEVQQIVAQLG